MVDKKNKKFEKIKVGEVFFSNFSNLSAVETWKDNEPSKVGWQLERISYQYGENMGPYVGMIEIKQDFLIAVKYLGNGIFEEMTTGEKLINGRNPLAFSVSGSRTNQFEHRELPDFDVPKNIISEDIVLDYEDYTVANLNKTTLSKIEYYQLLENLMKLHATYPLYLQSGNGFFDINEETKKLYLRNSDESRKEIIKEAKKLALMDAKKVNEKISTTLKNMQTLSKEELDMACLDNQLYDFKKRVRSK